jgi:3',5'-cyclic-AMP phosphodiesterase
MKIAWLSDIHLEFPEPEGLDRFYARLEKAAADGILISGDIGQSHSVFEYLRELQVAAKCPVYYVLGNHDYYYGSIASVRAEALRMRSSKTIRWLSANDVIPLTKIVCCIGHDGWGDSRNGDYACSSVRLNDFELISELEGLTSDYKRRKLMSLGDEAAAHIEKVLPEALAEFQHVVVVTHVPPFTQAAWWLGKPSAPDWQPFFSCKAVGDVLLKFMKAHPEKQMTVLCGHTHGSGNAKILPNLMVHTAGAQYGSPRIQKVFEWE